MNFSMLFLDVGPVGGTTGIVAAATFLLIFTAIAYIVFRILKRTVKMAVRMAIVVIILAIAVVGSVSLYFFGSGGPRPQRPLPTRTR